MGHSMMGEDSPLAAALPQDALAVLRGRFWERFLELGLPNAKHEAFHYLPLRRFALPAEMAPRREAIEIERHKLAAHLLVFIDGHFEEALSTPPPGCICLPLDKAMKTYGLVLHSRLSKESKEEADCFAALNGALHGSGAFLYVPPKVRVKEPVQILSLLSSDCLMAPRLQLFLGKDAQLDLIQTTHGSGIALDHLDVSVDQGAVLRLAESALLSADAWFFRSLRAAVKGRLSSFAYTEGAASHRQSLKVALSEPHAEVELKGLSYLRGERQAHTHVLVEHQAPHCLSRQHFKKALLDASRSSFEGKIFVHPIAQKTQAYQYNQNLLLSDQAAAHAKPNLEIFADDVKASHGATFSQFSEEELFYFRSRGLCLQEAKQVLFAGFCRDLIDGLEIPAAKTHLLSRL